MTSGGAAYKPGKGAVIGGALNGGLLTMTKGLASALEEKRIRVNTVVPGLVKTELWDKLGVSKEQQEKNFAEAAKKLSVGFVGTPKDIAEAYLYAVRADYANGTLIDIGKCIVRNLMKRRLGNSRRHDRWRLPTINSDPKRTIMTFRIHIDFGCSKRKELLVLN